MTKRASWLAASALGLALSAAGASAYAQDTTLAWKGAPQWTNDDVQFKVRGRMLVDYVFQDVSREGAQQGYRTSNVRGRQLFLGVEGKLNNYFAYKAEGGAANGGQIDADGTWSTTLTVPGATFQAADRNGNVAEIDCTHVQCGIITIGAHGVVNGTNESFTPVEVGDLYGGQAPAAAVDTAQQAVENAPQPGTVAAVAELTVDRTAALPGRIMAFTAVGLVPGELVVATLDDGLAAAGPIAVGTNGQVAGALELPLDLEPGTHTLKLSGEQGLSVSFAVRALDDASTTPWLAIGVAIGAGVLLLVTLVGSALWIRSARRKAVA